MIMGKIVRFTVKGRIPSKKNQHRIMGRKGAMSSNERKTFREWMKYAFICPSGKIAKWNKEAFIQLLLQKVPKGKFVCSMTELRIYYPDHRKADNTNKAETIMDMMVEYGVIEDDNWKCTGAQMLFGYHDKINPRVEITLWIN